MLEFIRQNYSQIITLIFIIVCFILMIISLFQKDDPSQKDFDLVLFKENKYNPDINKFSNTYVLFRRYVIIYQLVLFDKNGSRIFYSNIYPSKEKATSSFEFLKSNITMDNILYQETLNNKYYAIFKGKNKIIGFTDLFDTFEELRNSINSIIEIKESGLTDMLQFFDSIEPYSRNNKPKRLKNLEIEKIIDTFEVKIKSPQGIMLKSYVSKNKNDLKYIYEGLEEALLNKRIYIEKYKNKYRYLVLSKKYEILAFSTLRNTKDEVKFDLEQLYLLFE